MKKKILSVALVLVIVISSLAVSLTAFASAQVLLLDLTTSAKLSGSEDMAWFIYTPDKSGTYTLRSYNVPATEAYLFVKERDPETGQKKMIQLAYNAAKTTDKNRQFCLTYHLEAGVTYYYAAGWYLPSREGDSIVVKLVCDSVDRTDVERIEASCPVTYEIGLNCSVQKDSDGNQYFHYDLNRIIVNTRITVYYEDGTSVSALGNETIDGNRFTFKDNQYYDHWLPSNDYPDHRNVLTIEYLDKSTEIDIPITGSARYEFKGYVMDFAGQPIENATLTINNSRYYTNSQGFFSIYVPGGVYDLRISSDTSIDRIIPVTIAANNTDNDYTASPFKLCNCDYIKDGYINAKDFAYIRKNLTGDALTAAENEFHNSVNFDKEQYE